MQNGFYVNGEFIRNGYFDGVETYQDLDTGRCFYYMNVNNVKERQ